jgi:hypothetical protein
VFCLHCEVATSSGVCCLFRDVRLPVDLAGARARHSVCKCRGMLRRRREMLPGKRRQSRCKDANRTGHLLVHSMDFAPLICFRGWRFWPSECCRRAVGWLRTWRPCEICQKSLPPFCNVRSGLGAVHSMDSVALVSRGRPERCCACARVTSALGLVEPRQYSNRGSAHSVGLG